MVSENSKTSRSYLQGFIDFNGKFRNHGTYIAEILIGKWQRNINIKILGVIINIIV